MSKQNSNVYETLKNLDLLSDSVRVRLPVVCALLGCSEPTVWRMVRDGRLPAPKKLSPRCTTWGVGELRAVLARG